MVVRCEGEHEDYAVPAAKGVVVVAADAEAGAEADVAGKIRREG